MTRHLFRRVKDSLVPASDDAQEAIKKLKFDVDYWLEMPRRARNSAFHRKYFAMLTIAHENLPEAFETLWPEVEDLLYELKIQTHHFDEHVTTGGAIEKKVRSISFASMSQDEFEAFYTKSINFVCKHVIPGLEADALRDWVEEQIRGFQA